MFEFMTLWHGAKAAAAAEDAAGKLDAAKQSVRSVGDRVDDLRVQVDRLQMLCEGMWTLLKAKTDVSDADLAKLVEQIDLRDGKLDGRVAPKTGVTSCSSCGRTVSVRTGACLYCGTRNHTRDLF
ncbi:MAG: hypothetical protein JNL94_00720 [Planctomycetes bacterium]|nr:hypothetical protein [Planctomycetota bacterium]